MARQEQPREDLMREATAYTERAEVRLPNDQLVFLGWRPTGGFSVYCGEDPVYHFNGDGELRRAFVGGRLQKAEDGKLVMLQRQRSAAASTLARCEMSSGEQDEFLDEAGRMLEALRDQLQSGSAVITRSIPANAPVAQRLGDWLQRYGRPVVIAQRPNA